MEKFEELIQSEKPVLVDFFATWCGPCKAMNPVLEELKNEIGDAARIAKIDVDQHEELAARYRIQAVPTFIVFKKGEAVWRHSGVISGKDLKAVIEQNRRRICSLNHYLIVISSMRCEAPAYLSMMNKV